jgi:xanthine dehydrogenase small subunit
MDDSRRTIRFLLDGRSVTVDGVPPSTMLLDWLRTSARATGTKEGCAEGDCGACTVALARRLADGTLRVEPCNACIRPLASVDGCGVLTVEGLGGTHPAQREMVERHGSQCGFCTPGFVMAMCARLANGPVVDGAQACEALAGNLCRCTGYRPIVASLHAASEQLHPADGPSGAADRRVPPVAGLPAWVAALGPGDETPLAFEVDGLAWHAPRTAVEVDRLLAQAPDSWLLAGGTDIGLWVTKQLREPSRWIWLGAVGELQAVSVGEDGLSIGAAVSLADGFRALDREHPGLERYWSRFASPSIRASGTLVGNLANGSPIGDAAPVLIALGAGVTLRRAGPDGPLRRELPLESLYLDYRVQDRAPGEWIERVRVPRRRPGQRVVAWKLSKRVEQDISAVSLAASLVEVDGRLAAVRIALGGMAGTVRRAPHAEAALTGRSPAREAFVRAGAALAEDFSPLDDLRASREYRLSAAAGLLLRTWHALYAGDAAPASVEDPSLDALARDGGRR